MIQAYFSNIEKYILANLQKTTSEIKVAVAWLTNPRLFNAMLEQVKIGVTIEVIVADDRVNFSNPDINFQKLIDVGGILRISRYPRLMHHKFCVFDNRVLFTGSYNWTKNAELNNLENVILTTDLPLINQYIQAFEELRTITEKVTSVSTISPHDYTAEEEREKEPFILASTKSPDHIDPIETEPAFPAIEVPVEVVALYEQAELLYLQAKHDAALRLAERILIMHPDIAEAYLLIGKIKWRQGKFKDQVEFAQKAINVNPQFIEAYNLLGIGYSHLDIMNQSIKSYEVCLNHDPDDYSVIRNMAVSYIILEGSRNIPANLKNHFKQKANENLKRAIALADKYENERHDDYGHFYIKGMAKYELGKYIGAKPDLEKAIKLFEASPKQRQDVHELREMKAALRDIEAIKKTGL